MRYLLPAFVLSTLLLLTVFLTGLLPERLVETWIAGGAFPVLQALIAAPVSLVPFSVAELVLLLLALLLLASIVEICLCIRKRRSLRWTRRLAWSALSLGWLYVLSYGWLYQRPPLEQRLSWKLDVDQASFERAAKQLARAAARVRVRPPEPVDWDHLDRECRLAVQGALARLGLRPLPVTRLKPCIPSGFLLRFGVSGVYSPFTHEPHLDPALDPGFLPFTGTHELAHVAGLASEGEANFLAFLACTGARDPWLRYAGYLGVLPYFEGEASSALRKELRKLQGKKVLEDRKRIRERFRKKRSKTLTRISSKIYDRVLKVQGESRGIRSYGFVTRFVVASLRREDR